MKTGDRVAGRDVVARTLMPGPITPVNAANLLAVPPSEVSGCLLKREGERVAADEVLAQSKGLFGWFQKECAAGTAGVVETVSNVTGQVMIRGEPVPVEVRAYLTGRVVEVLPNEGVIVEAEATFVQGIFGVGGEAYGPIRMACGSPSEDLQPDLIAPDMRGAIVIGGARVTAAAVRRGVEAGVAAIVTGGIDDQDLRDFLGYDLGVAVTGSEKLGLTLIITEGFGDIAMAERTFQLLALRAGCDAAANGATQIRAGVMRPEIVVPWEKVSPPLPLGEGIGCGVLAVGRAVRIIRDPHFGIIGTVSGLPAEPRVLGSGSKARVLEVRLPSGETVSVPRANVEMIAE